ncbi:hypothetical protein PpBr36_00669 [Pyricularia pennisetigena]|uniref:hypothetical protein n=1 Tax=Pyricularia pennisetigena TaxID=1578925 RepID=UPI0011542757|nr:hypothetical protein PpBr36_00669 [Pyricularia pennisetigena]TLS29590.1 hypothetical protein PpBr36_00669 [Pyricularia pennisetigena]
MQFSTIIATIFVAATGAVALPAEVQERQVPYTPCSGLYGSAQCCATDILGLANLDCGQPSEAPANATNFSEICAAIGQRARCCVLPILDQGILCNTPAGVTP